jgi:hypothetical protein
MIIRVPKHLCVRGQIRVVARYDGGGREEDGDGSERLDAEPDGVDEVDNVRGKGAERAQEGGGEEVDLEAGVDAERDARGAEEGGAGVGGHAALRAQEEGVYAG